MKRLIFVLVLAVPAALLGRWVYARGAVPPGVLGEIARARPERVFPARFSVPTRYQRCTAVALPADSTVPRETCGARGDAPTDMVRLSARGQSLDPDTLHGSAIATIVWWDGMEESLNDAIDRLNEALRLASDTVPLLVDLSAAYLARAQHMQSPKDLQEALNAATRALALNPRNQAACWNKALAAALFGLQDEAASAWNAYLRLDATSDWADEAQQRLSRLDEPPESTSSSAGSEPEAPASSLRWDTLARWDALLGEWGSAVLTADHVRADSLLLHASRLGHQREQWGETSLTDAVQAIRDVLDAGDSRAIYRLARAHQAYSAALGGDTAATDSLARVLELQPPSPALRAWADVHHATRTSRLRSAEATDSLLARIDSLRHPLLTARIHWVHGKALIDRGEYAEGQIHARAAAQTFDRLKVADGYGATRSLEAWTLFEGGDTLTAYRYAHQALLRVERAGLNQRIQTLLVDMSQYAARQGMYHAAVVIADQVNAVARRLDDSARRAEAMLTRVELGRLAGETERMRSYIDSSAVLIASLSDNPDTKRLRNILRYTRAMQQPVGRLDASVAAELDSAIAQFSTASDTWRVASLMRRADEYLHKGDHTRAEADLDSITAVFQRNAHQERAFHLRSAVMEEARSRFDQLMMLHLRNGNPRDALRALELGRVSLAPTGDTRTASGGHLAAPRGQSVVEYALIGDTLYTWTVRDTSVALWRQRVDGDNLRLAIEQASAALREGERDALSSPHLVRLYDLLIRPVRSRLWQDSTLVIIADGEIAGVPFVALRDTSRDRLLVDDYPLRYAASLAEARRPAPSAPLDADVQALLVADPAFDDSEYRRLYRLRDARTEVRSLLLMYPGADTLADSAATVATLWDKAPGADVIHYAGHAVFDDTRPERSFLVLAGRGDTGRLTADSISALDLHGVRIVVLSACSTLRGRHGRSGGFAGLSGALLSAGAGGMVGSMWKVNDKRALPLMLWFHEAYRESGNAAKALRTAQLRMIRRNGSPSVWAGFRYMGR